MPRLLRCLAIVLILAVPAIAAAGDLPTAPAGWTMNAGPSGVYYQSPSNDAGAASVLIPPAEPGTPDFKNFFDENVPAAVEDLFGEIVRQTAATTQSQGAERQGVTSAAYLVRSDEEAEIRVHVAGLATATASQLVFVVAAVEVAQDGVAFKQAISFAGKVLSDGFVLTAEKLAAAQTAGAATHSSVSDDGEVSEALPPLPDDPEARIENVIYYLRLSFDGTGTVGSDDLSPITAALLINGRVLELEGAAPAAIDPASRPKGSKGAGKWVKDGEGYSIVWDDGTGGTAVSIAAKTFAAPASMTLSGRYVAISPGASPGLPSAVMFHDDQSVSLEMTVAEAGGTPEGASARYKISRRTIEFAKSGGTSTAHIFGYQGERERPSVLVIGTRLYERLE